MSKSIMCWEMSYKCPQKRQCGYMLHQLSPQLWIDKIPFRDDFDDNNSTEVIAKQKLNEISETNPNSLKLIASTIKIKSPIISNFTVKDSLTRRKKCSPSYTSLDGKRRSIIKTQLYKSTVIAKPDYVCFHNFEKNRLYRKIVTLTNVSNVSTKFRIDSRSNHSKFKIVIKDETRETNLIAAGVQLKLIVLFYTKDVCEQEETVTIYVKNGKPIDITLRCTRDPPILKRINRQYTQNLVSSIDNLSIIKSVTNSSDSWESYTSKRSSTVTESNILSESSKCSDISQRQTENLNMILECGKCFVGEQVALQIKYKNCGGDGRFFIMSEIDWYSMFIEDITDTNILSLQSFAVWPAYFALKSGEDIFIHVYFFPDSFGMHVDTLYIISDNYSFKSTELVGDGFVYESQMFHIKGSQETCLFLINIDKQDVAHYGLNLQLHSSNAIIKNRISITNTSQMYVFFRWEKCDIQDGNQNEIAKNKNLMDFLHIEPESGIFPASTELQFNVIITNSQFHPSDNQVYGFLQLYIEDIPQAAILKQYNFQTVESKTKRRVCSNPVDILVADIKLMQQLYYDTTIEKKSWTLDDYIIEIDEESTLLTKSKSSIEEEWLDDPWYMDTTMCKSIERCLSLPVLMLEELHSTLDIIDIGSIKPFFESVIGSGVLRPLRLFLGITETLTIYIKNILSTPVMYKWGNPMGVDSLKLNTMCCPESGCIQPGIVEKVQITCCPIKVGYIQALHIPCYIGCPQKIVFLQVECEIKSLHVTFYFPYSNDKDLIVSKNGTSIEWNSSSICIYPDLSSIQKLMLTKTILRKNEEMQESLSTEITLQEMSIESLGSSQRSSNEEKIISDNVDIEESDSSSEDLTDKIGWLKNQTRRLINSSELNASSAILPFHEIKSMSQPVVIEFIEVPLGVVTKKSFLIRNQTPISSSFWLKIQNFYPVYITQKGRIKQDMLKSIYKNITDHQTEEDIWKEMKQPNSGILIYVNPLITRLGPYQDVLVDIYVFVDTWGIYVDQLEIHIRELPVYALAICVQVSEVPISFPISEKTKLKIPVCRFGQIPVSCPKISRIVFIKNRSSIPLMINWHVVTVENNILPFNVVLHVRVPFTNDLAMVLRKRQKEDKTEKLVRNRLQICESQNNNQKIDDYTFDIFSYEYTDSCTLSENDNYVYTNKSKTLEFQMDLIPYNLMNQNICTVYPNETFISPKGKAYIKIKVFPDKCPLDKDRYKILCHILGFIQIAPMDEYKDRHYCRSNKLLTPVKIQIEAEIVKPQLVYDIPKCDRLFIICADDVMRNPRDVTKVKRMFTFHNNEKNSICVRFEINGPFMIEQISTGTDTIMNDFTEEIYVEGQNSLQIHIAGLVDATLIEDIMETNKNINLKNKSECPKEKDNWCDKGLLLITYADHNFETLELYLKIHLPSLRLSSQSLNFGNVCIGDTRKFLLDIENLSACKFKVKIASTMLNEDFTYYPVEGDILPRPITGKRILTITVCFSPRNIGSSKEILMVMSTIPNYAEKCVLCGVGVTEKKISEIEMQ